MSFGFDKSSSSSQESSKTFVDPNQQAALDFSRQLAQNLATGQGQGLQNQFGVAEGLVGQGQDLLGQNKQIAGGLQNFQAGGFGQGQGGIDALTGLSSGSNPSLQALQQQAQGINPNLQNQIDLLGADITKQFERGLGGIRSEAVGGGQLGGGRQGVAEGLLGEAAGDQFARGASQLRSDDIGRQLAAAGQVAGIQGQAGGQLGQLGLQQGQGGSQQQLQALLGAGQTNLGGISALTGVQNLGFEPFAQQLNPALALSSVVGPATVLSESQGTSKSSSFGISGGGLPV